MDAHPQGIIPALAGNTTILNCATRSAADHPRSRGEYHAKVCRERSLSGSSPLSRGIQLSPEDAGRLGGDHPRSRGEYS